VWGWLLLLWGIYLTECVVTVGSTDVTLCGRRVKRFRASRGAQLSRINADRGWLLLPLWPATPAFVAAGDDWNSDDIIERVTRLGASTRLLSILSGLLGVALLVVTPVLLVTSRIEAVLWQWLAVLVVLDLAVIVSFVRTRRRLQPRNRPLKPLVLAMLSPIAAIRLAATLAIDCLRDAHPTAAAIALATDEDVLAVARRAWFDEPDDRKRIEKALKKRELFNALLRPPVDADGTSSAYCPRCHQQYCSGAELCADCASIGLLPLSTR
jgi:hypothetical protein